MLAPTIHTPRLTLRGHTPQDLADCVALWSDPQIIRYTTRQTLARQDVWTRLLRHPGHWALLGYGYWLVFEQETGQLLGEMGLADFRRMVMEPYPQYAGIPEAGWVLLPQAQGKGYAFEALSAILGWRDEHLSGQLTYCLIDPENTPSLKLAARLGFAPQMTIQGATHETVVLVREQKEEEAARRPPPL